MKRALFALVLISSGAAHAARFDLDKNAKGDQVCRSDNGVCYQSVSGMSLNQAVGVDSKFPSTIEIVDQIKAFAKIEKSDKKVSMEELDGAAAGFTLNAENRTRILREFSRLSVRNVALDMNSIQTTPDGFTIIPFYASVYWIGTWRGQGTINVKGELRLNQNETLDLSAEATALNNALAKMFTIQDISDSSTQPILGKRIAALRVLENTTRFLHVKTSLGVSADVDAETRALLKSAVGPAVAGSLYVPVMKQMATAIANGMADVLTDALKQAIEGTIQDLSKP